jgi:hypothetical protein
LGRLAVTVVDELRQDRHRGAVQVVRRSKVGARDRSQEEHPGQGVRPVDGPPFTVAVVATFPGLGVALTVADLTRVNGKWISPDWMGFFLSVTRGAGSTRTPNLC